MDPELHPTRSADTTSGYSPQGEGGEGEQSDERSDLLPPLRTKNRLIGALLAYGVLIGASWFMLAGTIRLAVIALFIALIAKTLIAFKAGW
jgi:hypothetical protein